MDLSSTVVHGFTDRFSQAFQKTYKEYLHTNHMATCRHVCAFCRVGWLPAGSHHMSLLLAPALPLPGPPWPPAHTPQAAETETETEK